MSLAREKPARQGGAATVGMRERGEDAHGGRLSGPVRTEDAQDRALLGIEAEAVERVRLAEGFVEADGLDHGVRHRCVARLKVHEPA